MQIFRAIIIAAMAALPALATPALARKADAQKTETTEEQSSAPACHSYVQTPDGEWKPIPCAEVGAEARTQRKTPAGNADAATH
jgi:hypothetical protein